MTTEIVEVPDLVNPAIFPTPSSDSAAYNRASRAWADQQQPFANSLVDIAESAHTNALATKEIAQAADQSKRDAEQAVSDAQQEVGLAKAETRAAELARGGAEDAMGSAQAAAAAAGDAAGLPALAGNAGKVLTVNPDELGVSFRRGVPARGQQLYTASQNISKSMFGDATYVFVELWGGGGSGAANCRNAVGFSASGGEGGAYDLVLLRVEDLPDEIPLVIGAGGVAVSATWANAGTNSGSRNANPGGNSSFGSFLEVAGGLGGWAVIAAGNAIGSSRLLTAGLRGKELGGPGGGFYATGTAGYKTEAGPGGSTAQSGPGGGAADAYAAAWSVGGKSLAGAQGGVGVMRTVNATDPVKAGDGVGPGAGGGAITWSSPATGQTITSGAGAPGQAKLTWW